MRNTKKETTPPEPRPAGQGITGLHLENDEIGVIVQALMQMPVPRADPRFAIVTRVLAKIRQQIEASGAVPAGPGG